MIFSANESFCPLYFYLPACSDEALFRQATEGKGKCRINIISSRTSVDKVMPQHSAKKRVEESVTYHLELSQL
jgi:hypothetical protein